MSYAEFQQADRRLVLLKALEAAAMYRANAYLLRRYCDHVGHVVSAAQLEKDLQWLAGKGLLELSQDEGVAVATLKAAGLDVATGRTRLAGVAVPQPGA